MILVVKGEIKSVEERVFAVENGNEMVDPRVL